MAVEMVIFTPILGGVILLIAALTRVGLAQTTVEAAVSSSAREVSLSRSATTGDANARNVAINQLSQSGVNCIQLGVQTDTSGLNARLGSIGSVTVTITCTVNLSDIAIPGLPGTHTITKSASSPVDPYRVRS